MNEEGLRTSSELIRWLKLLALPLWAKVAIAFIMLITLANALHLLLAGMVEPDRDAIASGVTLLTVGLPIGLIVVAVVFNDGGASRLRELTRQVLHEDIPSALRNNFDARPFVPADWVPDIRVRVHGCAGSDSVVSPPSEGNRELLSFVVELNVHKINLVIQLNGHHSIQKAADYFERTATLTSCLTGALNEGYRLIEMPEHRNGTTGLVLTRTLARGFPAGRRPMTVLRAGPGIFLRGMIEAHRG